ncbi:DUF4262 domain-containing protein (plasmid) [Streptosporangium sp. NBC_01495]|uniref:hypothetical protein n=1 Tax=Streptosporangium sp. NBC_01495 TaxID=2903899 RepID=UPI002E32005E|nr:hypothetical protein [Streptosporangium sp. NBC_01495]
MTAKERTKLERFDRAMALLNPIPGSITAACLAAHPVEDCLPVPELLLPSTPEEVSDVALSVFLNVWQSNGSRPSAAWAAARSGCTHLTIDQVATMNSLIIRWYQLLTDVRRYVDAEPGWTQWQYVEVGREVLNHALAAVTAIPLAPASAREARRKWAEEYLRGVGSLIQKHGWAVQAVGDEGMPWAYTIGLSDRGH